MELFSWKVDMCLESTLDYSRFTSQCAHGVGFKFICIWFFSLPSAQSSLLRLRVRRELINVYIAPSMKWVLVQAVGILSD